MRRHLLALPLTVVTLACNTASDTELRWSADTLYASATLLRDLTDPANATLLRRPMAVRTASGLYFVSDVDADRVAVLDSTAALVRMIGHRGRGPGELLGTSHIATRNDRLFVSEALNGRISEFTLRGEFVRSYASPFAADALALTATRIYAAARSSTHYAALVDGRSEPRNALRRASPPARDAHIRADRGADLIAADSAEAWVFDVNAGSLCEYAHADRARRCVRFPRALLSRLREYRNERVAAVEKAKHVRVTMAPMAKDMVRVGTLLAILLPLPELGIVLVDPDDGALTPVLLREGAMPSWVRAARGLAWTGRGFVLAGDYGVGRLDLSPVPSDK